VTYGCWTAPRRTRQLLALLSSLVSLSTAGACAVALVRVVHGREPGSIALLPVMAAAVYLGVRTAFRIRQMSLSITSREVVIVGPLRTTRVPISEAQQFFAEVRPVGRNGQPMIALRRAGAEPVNVWALSRNGFVWNSQRLAASLHPLAGELNQWLSEAKTGAAD
jgi:hypothetical protein